MRRYASPLYTTGERRAAFEGDFQVDWIFIESALDDNKFKGYVTKLEGNWKRP